MDPSKQITRPDGPLRVMLCFLCNERRASNLDTCPDCGGALEEVGSVDLLETQSLSETTAPDAAWSDDDLVGKEFGPYELQALAGQGGMGRVYRAHHSGLGRPCAVKVLNPELVRKRPRYAELFVQEARSAAALIHPNVVTVHNILRSGELWMIEMEWVDGSALNHAWAKDFQTSYRATQIMLMIASALAAAHRHQIVHRDLKPSNVLVTREGQAKLADFGLAKGVVARSAEEPVPGLAGTPYFMAPELFVGKPATPRSDIYAAGITYYYLLTEQYPYRSDSFPELLRMHRNAEIPDVSTEVGDAPQRTQRIIDRCLAKKPDDRYEDGQELYEDLRTLLGSLRRLEDLIEEALEGLDLTVRRVDNGFEVDVSLEGDRHQVVTIEETRSEYTGERLLRVWSPCGPVDDAYLQRALEINGEVYHGALAIQDHHGRRYFVMRNNYPRATCDPEEIRSSVLAIAQRSDDVESMLIGSDMH